MNKANKIRILNIAGLLSVAIFFIGDRILKIAALSQGTGISRRILSPYFHFYLTFNPYISFSLPLSGLILTIILTIIALSLVSFIIYSLIKKKNKELIIPLTFILFGAISNLIDRYSFGAVIDYFDLRYFSVFNLGDVMITIGSIFVLLKIIKRK